MPKFDFEQLGLSHHAKTQLAGNAMHSVCVRVLCWHGLYSMPIVVRATTHYLLLNTCEKGNRMCART